MIHFDLPKEQSSIIKVIGVGGGGSNAVNYMFSQDIESVNFVICNTDAQALALSSVPNKIQLGPNLTQGLGAGANPEIGRQATEESLEEIRRILEVNTKMVFVTAGMGGGTGTGGAPIVAKISKDLGILTVGIVTTPFAYEGKKRIMQAEEGINKLKEYVDTLLVISNDKLRHQFGNLTMRSAFTKADNVLATAAKCITDVINSTGQINVDFADVCTVMRSGGVAILGSAAAEGEDRAQKAIEQALNSPLLNDNDIQGARWILININSSEGEHEFTMDEVETIQNYLLSHAGENTDVILGMGYDNTLESKIGITLIATGFHHKNPFDRVTSSDEKKDNKDEKIILTLNGDEEKKAELKSDHEADVKDPMAPILVEGPEIIGKQTVAGKIMEEKFEELTAQTQKEIILFEINSVPSSRQLPTENLQPEKATLVHHPKQENKEIKEASTTPTSGGYLAKPSNIYAEEPIILESKKEDPVEKPHQLIVKQEESTTDCDMKLVLKETPAAEELGAPSTHITLASVEDPALQDETEEQKRKAAERLNKLRNLSFNINAADPNNEFEAVPAYIRRNLFVHNTALTSVEKFYSNYTVKSDENNQAQISTINTFLEGKKPD
jgi:cell division protein FtsZ